MPALLSSPRETVRMQMTDHKLRIQWAQQPLFCLLWSLVLSSVEKMRHAPHCLLSFLP